jgi:hypothetical protein
MTSSARSFRDLVEAAHEGQLKLPAFQRRWRWRSDKVVKLFDSLRQRFPIGALLFLKGENSLLAPRTFEGAHEQADGKSADFLVLDGQQRITAGIHLFYATGPKQYYLDLNKLDVLAKQQGVDLENKAATEEFVASLDDTDSYLIARKPHNDPRALLIQKHLLCTSILADSTDLMVALNQYVKAVPERENLAQRLIMPHFNLSKTDTVPVIEIEAATQIEAISRIFTTLNTTGQMLTPFELVVSILYPQKIDLAQEIADFRERGAYYPRMDDTGEILLQAVAMLAGKDPKKSTLPKTIDGTIYQQHKETAFQALEGLGKFLTDMLGAGLDVTSDLVPYDAIYAPMALAHRHIGLKGEKAKDRIEAEKKLARWYAGAALSERYGEGVHSKQARDLAESIVWIDGGAEPAWLTDVTTPRLLRKSPSGAIGKLLRSMINKRHPVDPVSNRPIGFRSGAFNTEKHHMFPIKYLPNIDGWQKKDSGDVILNLMFLEAETNKRWINGNPSDHIIDAKKVQPDGVVTDAYRQQFVDGSAMAILINPQKSKKEFDEFLALRESTFQAALRDEFGFEFVGSGETDIENEDLGE